MSSFPLCEWAAGRGLIKGSATGLVDSLRNELILYGITVHLALPASILSPSFIDYEQKIKPELTKKIEGPDEPLTPHEVAARLLKGAFRRVVVRYISLT